MLADGAPFGFCHRGKRWSEHISRVDESADHRHHGADVYPPHAHREHRAQRWVHNSIMIHEILPVGMLQCNCSIFGDEKSREAVVIDPGDEIDRILTILAQHQLRVKAIFITHAHIDHVGGAEKLKAVTGAPVYMNANDEELYSHLDMQAGWLGIATPQRTEVDVDAREGSSLKLGDAEFQVLHTPGHTQGSISVWIPAENKLIA